MKKFFLLVCFYFLACSSAFASAYWIDITGSGRVNDPVKIELCYGSMDKYGVRKRDSGKELELAGDFRIRIIDTNGNEQQLILTMQKDCWTAKFTPKNIGQYRIIGINDKHPVVDRSASGGENILPIDYITAFYTVGNAVITQENPLQLLDFTAVTNEDKVTIKAFFEGKPSKAGTKLRIFNPENWEKELILDTNGQAEFYPTMKGLYIIRQDWKEPVSGEYQGVKFNSKRHRCNLFIIY